MPVQHALLHERSDLTLRVAVTPFGRISGHLNVLEHNAACLEGIKNDTKMLPMATTAGSQKPCGSVQECTTEEASRTVA